MKKILILTVTLIVFSISIQSQNLKIQLEWAGSINEIGTENVVSIIDKKGNIYLTGSCASGDKIDFDSREQVHEVTIPGVQYHSSFIAKLNNNGNLLWVKTFTGNDVINARSIAVDSIGDVYVTGVFAGTIDFNPDNNTTFEMTATGHANIFILKLDEDGSFVWAKEIGYSSEYGHSANAIALDDSSNVYITGSFDYTADFDPGDGIFNMTAGGNYDIYILKLNKQGGFVWAKQMISNPTGSSETGTAIAVDKKGNVYTSGSFIYPVDFDPGNNNSILSSNGSYDIFISKLSPSGDFLWAKSIGGSKPDFPSSISLDQHNNVYIGGSFNASVDFDPGNGVSMSTARSDMSDAFILKLDSLGNFRWARQMGGSAYSDNIKSIFADSNSNLYATGSFVGATYLNPGNSLISSRTIYDTYIALTSKFDSLGNLVWVEQIGDGETNLVEGWSINVDLDSNIYNMGRFRGAVTDFDPATDKEFNISPVGNYDLFIQKINEKLTSEIVTSAVDQSLSDNHLLIYPNPVTNALNIILKNPSNARMSLIDMHGNSILNEFLVNENSSFDISFLSEGVYLIRINGDFINTNHKILVTR